MLMDLELEQRTIEEVSALTGLAAPILAQLVRYGVLTGQVGTCDVEQAREIADKLKQARVKVSGQVIKVLDAQAKYGFDTNSIYRWSAAGWVRVSATTPAGDRLFNEEDIAFARELADIQGHVPGRAVFPARPRSGRPRKNP
jgi:hypothetical protein